MGLLDDVLGSAVPGGNLVKPLMVGLAALLGARAVGRGLGNLLGGAGCSAQTPSTAAPTGPASASPPQGGLLGGLGGLLQSFQQSGQVMSSIPGSGLGRTNRLRQISCTEPSVPTRSITCLA
jgi:hypothetical protein